MIDKPYILMLSFNEATYARYIEMSNDIPDLVIVRIGNIRREEFDFLEIMEFNPSQVYMISETKNLDAWKAKAISVYV